jgi:hypothetical protein
MAVTIHQFSKYIPILDHHTTILGLPHECHMQLAKHNGVHLLWVPGHEGIVGNEIAD